MLQYKRTFVLKRGRLCQKRTLLELADAQIKKAVVYASDSGVLLTCSLEPGEVVQAGAPLMRLGQLDNLKLTIMAPSQEDVFLSPATRD